ncbi:MAG: hypothetical protein AAB532_01620 [Patescibacteria group bacterium]
MRSVQESEQVRERTRVVKKLAKSAGLRWARIGAGWSDDSSPIDVVAGGIHDFMQAGVWNGEMEERLDSLARFGMITVERYVEAARKIAELPLHDPILGASPYSSSNERTSSITEYELKTLYDNTISVYRRCGERAGAYFLYSYPGITVLGQDQKAFADTVIQAKETGGAHFGAWLAYELPTAIEAGTSMAEFSTSASIVRNKSTLKYTKEFMRLAPHELRNGNSLLDFTDTALLALEELDPQSAINILPAVTFFGIEFGMDPGAVLDDASKHSKKYGDKSAGWYTRGLRRIAKEVEDSRKAQKSLRESPQIAQWMDVKPLVDPSAVDSYKEGYEKVVTEAGRTVAVFYARYCDIRNPLGSVEQILEARRVLPRNIFNKGLWVISKITPDGYADHGIEELQDLISLTDNISPADVIDALNYTLGASKKGVRTGIIDPKEARASIRMRNATRIFTNQDEGSLPIEYWRVKDSYFANDNKVELEANEPNPFPGDPLINLTNNAEILDQWIPVDRDEEMAEFYEFQMNREAQEDTGEIDDEDRHLKMLEGFAYIETMLDTLRPGLKRAKVPDQGQITIWEE